MTDPKGDRSKAPHDQRDKDMFVRIKERREDGIVVRGAKVHQTGSINSHWHIVMPTQAMSEADISFLPVPQPQLRLSLQSGLPASDHFAVLQISAF